MECLGGGGYVEESPLPRLYREAPVNAIWEGSGNVIALDVAAHSDKGSRSRRRATPGRACNRRWDRTPGARAGCRRSIPSSPAKACRKAGRASWWSSWLNCGARPCWCGTRRVRSGASFCDRVRSRPRLWRLDRHGHANEASRPDRSFRRPLNGSKARRGQPTATALDRSPLHRACLHPFDYPGALTIFRAASLPAYSLRARRLPMEHE